METESEFGKGLTYCIGLFLCHSDKAIEYKQQQKKSGFAKWPEMWFNGSSDHLYELNVSKVGDKKLQANLEDWAKKVIHWGHGFSAPYPTEDDVFWSISEAKEFLRLIDEKMLNTETITASWH